MYFADHIKKGDEPYDEIVKRILKEMEIHVKRADSSTSEIIYTINPRIIGEEIKEKIEHEKISLRNVSKTALALLYGSGLKKDDESREGDFYTSVTGGAWKYHVRANRTNLDRMSMFAQNCL